MRTKNVIAIVLTVIIFLAASVLGVTSVYRVSEVTLDVSLISAAAENEADALQKRLLERYAKESIFSVDDLPAKEEFADFPYFRMTSFSKVYPNRLVVSAAEDEEVFAVEGEGKYYILGGDGILLGIREDAFNRSDGKENVIVSGMTPAGERGQILGGDSCIPAFIDMCRAMSSLFDGLRANLVRVEVLNRQTSSSANITFRFYMREGVKINVLDPLRLTERKAGALSGAYLGLEEERRLGGSLFITELSDRPGEIDVVYSKMD